MIPPRCPLGRLVEVDVSAARSTSPARYCSIARVTASWLLNRRVQPIAAILFLGIVHQRVPDLFEGGHNG
jgi:hypothetical protein